MKKLQGNGIVAGIGKGEAIVSSTPFGFFGGVNPTTGIVIDKWHELFGQSISGKIFIYPEGRGSTVGAAIMLELARSGFAPAAIINVNVETITAAGGLLAKKFYDTDIPIVDGISMEDLRSIKQGTIVEVNGETGQIVVFD